MIIHRKSNVFYFLFACLCFFGGLNTAFAQTKKGLATLPPTKDSAKITQPDSANQVFSKDTVVSIASDSLDEDAFEDEVSYEAEDSIRMDVEKKEVHLFNKAKVKYQTINLEAGYIIINYDKNLITAVGIPDSSGRMSQYPVFKEEGKDDILSKQIVYNIKTKKAKIKDVVTKSGESFLLGQDVKMMKSDELFMRGMKYTTCNDNDHPHFYLNLTKAKVVPGKKIIAGPSYMILEDVPLPIALPFGYFPVMNQKKAGIIFPEYGESPNQGFFLRNGGYYIPINDYVDLRLQGDIYSLGSWRINSSSNYMKRYKYNGNLNISYSNTQFGERTDPGFNRLNDFMIRWSHNQDAKASPYGRFSASVEAGTGNYLTNNSFAVNNYIRNSLNSSISYTRNFQGKPFSLTLSGRHSQNTQTKEVNITLPELFFGVNQFQPFKSKKVTGAEPFYRRINMSYRMSTRSDYKATDSTIFKGNFLDSLRFGVQHDIPLSINFNLLKYFTVTPGMSYTERWYTNQILQRYDPETRLIKKDTVRGFYRLYDYSFNVGVNFRLFGLVQFKKGKLAAIRHVMTPTLGFSYRPDFSASSFGYYQTVRDSSGNVRTYSPFSNGIYGVPSSGRSGIITLNLDNNLEAKIRTKSDSAGGVKKIKLFDSFNINTSYNLAVDSFQLAPINVSGRTSFTNGFSIQYGGSFEPYRIDPKTGVRTKELYLASGEWTLAKLTQLQFVFTGSIRGKAQAGNFATRDIAIRQYNPNSFIDFKLPYSLNFNYILNYTPSAKEGGSSFMRQSLAVNGDVRITTKWKVGFNTNYDMMAGELTGTQVSIYRDLHCWDMSFNWIPFGFRQSYTFDLRVRSSILQELRLTRRRDWYDQ